MAVRHIPTESSRSTHLPGARPLPLANGDRLTRQEFERRYAARPDLKKAELIEGVVYMPSPVHFAAHAEPHGVVLAWLVTYCALTPGVRVADNATVRLDLDNEPQPDALLRIEPAAGGRSRLSADDYVEGAPELIVEIAASSASYDLHDKMRAYRRNGVPEYLVWRVYENQFDWFVLADLVAQNGAWLLDSDPFFKAGDSRLEVSEDREQLVEPPVEFIEPAIVLRSFGVEPLIDGIEPTAVLRLFGVEPAVEFHPHGVTLAVVLCLNVIETCIQGAQTVFETAFQVAQAVSKTAVQSAQAVFETAVQSAQAVSKTVVQIAQAVSETAFQGVQTVPEIVLGRDDEHDNQNDEVKQRQEGTQFL